MYYLDHETGHITNDEDLAIAWTGSPYVTNEVDAHAAALVIEGVLEPLYLGEVA